MQRSTSVESGGTPLTELHQLQGNMGINLFKKKLILKKKKEEEGGKT